jgi:hypothetical protein
MRFLNSKKSFQSLRSEYSLRTDLEVPDISYFTDFRQTRGAKKIPKTDLNIKLKTKETSYTLVFVKYLVVSFRSHSNKGMFSVFVRFIEDYLRNLMY